MSKSQTPRERWRAQRSQVRYQRWRDRQPRLRQRVHFSLGEAQGYVFRHPARFRVLVAGRRFGKTWLAVIELVLAALLRRGATCWYVAPTRDMARDIAWEALKATLRLLPASFVLSISESRLTVRFRNGSIIQLKSAHNPDSLRGRALDFVVVDECALLKWVLVNEVLLPALADRQGRALFITTPKGFNWVYDKYVLGIAGRWQDITEWASFTFTSLDGGRIPEREIEARRVDMDARTFRQEFLASFEALGGRVYDCFDRERNVRPGVADRVRQLIAAGTVPLRVGFDFNVNPMTAVVVVPDGREVLVAACIQAPTSLTSELAKAVITVWGNPSPATSRPQRTMIAHPDASGKNRDTRSGTTDHQLLINAGFVVDAPLANPPVIDRVNAVNALLCNAKGDRSLFIDPAAVALIRALDGQVWRENVREPEKKDGLDHPNDALGYVVHRAFNRLGAEWRPAVVKW